MTMVSRPRLWSALLASLAALAVAPVTAAQPAGDEAPSPAPERPDWFGDRKPLRRAPAPPPPSAAPAPSPTPPPRWFGDEPGAPPPVSRNDRPEWFTEQAPLAPPLSEQPKLASRSQSREQMRLADASDVQRTAGYRDGFFVRSEDGEYQLRLNGQLQVLFDYQGVDGLEDRVAFSLHRARLRSWAQVGADLQFFVHFSGDEGVVGVRDAYLDYELPEGNVHIQAGQQRKPYSRQFIAESLRLALVERSITHIAFDAGRDLGVTVHNDYTRSPAVEYAVGVYNGRGALPSFTGEVQVDPASGLGRVDSTSESNVPNRFRPTVVARLGFNHGGGDGYSETDFHGGRARLGVAVGAQSHFDVEDDDDSGLLTNVDYYLKAYGFSTSGAVYLRWGQDPLSTSFSDQLYQAAGMHIQASYLIGRLLEPALRYGRINRQGPDNDVREVTAAINIYARGHDLKLQTEAGALFSQAPGDQTRGDTRLRVQLQGAF
jgi:hypothetical protein